MLFWRSSAGASEYGVAEKLGYSMPKAKSKLGDDKIRAHSRVQFMSAIY